MLINIFLLLIGIVLLLYGIKNKLRFFIIAGVVLLCFGMISIGIDYKMGDGDFANGRVPFVIDGMMK